MFRWTWEPEPSWQEELSCVTGAEPNRRVPWSLLVWEPGENMEPLVVQRWMLYEMIPPPRLYQQQDASSVYHANCLLDALNGPSPRSLRTWKRVPDKKDPAGGGRWLCTSDSLVTQMQWELWHRWGCYGMPYWVIQGVHGGHKRSFNHIESRLLKLHQRRTQPPDAGDLPFAPWDNRVFSALAEERRIRETFDGLGGRDAETQTAEDHRRRRRALARQTGIELLGWLDRQLAEGIAAAPVAKKSERNTQIDNAPTTGEITDEQMEQAEGDFLDYMAPAEA
jgi:hypothetical protein